MLSLPGALRWRPQRLPLAGTVCVLASAALIHWTVSNTDVLTGLRASAVEAIGIGVFLIIGLVLVGGFWLITGARWRPDRRTLRRLIGALLLFGVLLGLSGLLRPAWSLGGVDLREATVGGELGDRLGSPAGSILILLLLLAGALLLSPWGTLRLLHACGRLAVRLPSPRLHRPLPPDPWTEAAFPFPGPTYDPALDEHPPDFATQESRPAGPATLEDAPAASTGPGAGAAQEELADNSGAHTRRSHDGWQLPPLAILRPDPAPVRRPRSAQQARLIVETLASFGVDAKVMAINEGPTITQFGLEPGWEIKTRTVSLRDEAGRLILDAHGQPQTREEEVSRTRVRVTRITRLANDLALALAAPAIRVEAPVPGKPIIGIEVPNVDTRIVTLRGVVGSPEFKRVKSKGGLPLALGRNVEGAPVVVDLTQMPHLLIAGATGSGKSVCINSIMASLLMHFSPEALRLVVVDPKRVELTGYGKIPHLVFSHVVTDPDESVGVLGVVVTEMERRYRRFQTQGVRNLAAYNEKDRPEGKLPYWVVIIDELADLMLAAPVEVEQQVVRIAQLARATGIHLIIATQRPSVNVVTGLIKANFPSRVAFATTSQVDSRVILDHAGAEKLLGRGDMLFQGTDSLRPRRLQGTFVSDLEIENLITFWTQDRFTTLPRPTLDHLLQEAARTAAEQVLAPGAAAPDGGDPSDDDALYQQARTLAQEHTRISTSLLQRRLRIGYPRAARLIDTLEAQGVIGPAEGGQSRRVLVGSGSNEP